MKLKWISWMAVVVVIGGGVYWWSHLKKSTKSDGSLQKVAAISGPIEEVVEANGEVSPLNRVEIKPPISGRIEQLLVEEGHRVKSGAILAWMSSSDRAAVLDAARALGPAEVKKWEDSYKATPIVAPLSGVIILKNVVVGQTVDPSTILFAMSDKLIVVAQVDESDIGKVHVQMPARIVLDAYPQTSIQGSVFQILYEGKNVSNVITYGVKIEPRDVPSFFRSQMTANVSLVVRHKDAAVLIPSSSIHSNRAGGTQVQVPGPDDKPVLKDVELGIESGDQVEIVSGIEAGDFVLVKQGKYVPQKALESSPLTPGPRRTTSPTPGQSGTNRTGTRSSPRQ